MPATFRLEIVSQERTLHEADDVVSVDAPGAEGSFGVMANHRPMMAALQAGIIEMRDVQNKGRFIVVTGGFLEVSRNRTVVLADAAELAEEIDVDRARDALSRAQERLGHLSDGGVDRQRAQRAKQRATARLKASKQGA